MIVTNVREDELRARGYIDTMGVKGLPEDFGLTLIMLIMCIIMSFMFWVCAKISNASPRFIVLSIYWCCGITDGLSLLGLLLDVDRQRRVRHYKEMLLSTEAGTRLAGKIKETKDQLARLQTDEVSAVAYKLAKDTAERNMLDLWIDAHAQHPGFQLTTQQQIDAEVAEEERIREQRIAGTLEEMGVTSEAVSEAEAAYQEQLRENERLAAEQAANSVPGVSTSSVVSTTELVQQTMRLDR